MERPNHEKSVRRQHAIPNWISQPWKYFQQGRVHTGQWSIPTRGSLSAGRKSCLEQAFKRATHECSVRRQEAIPNGASQP